MIDESILSEIGDNDVIIDVLTTFLDDAARLRREIEASIGTFDRDALSRASHQLKSTAGSVGAGDLAAATGEIETAARKNDPEAARAALVKLRAAYDPAEQHLRAWLVRLRG